MEETGYELFQIKDYNPSRGDYTLIEKHPLEGVRMSLINSKDGLLYEKIINWNEVISKAIDR